MKTYIKPTTHVCYIDPDELLTIAIQSKAFAGEDPSDSDSSREEIYIDNSGWGGSSDWNPDLDAD